MHHLPVLHPPLLSMYNVTLEHLRAGGHYRSIAQGTCYMATRRILLQKLLHMLTMAGRQAMCMCLLR